MQFNSVLKQCISFKAEREKTSAELAIEQLNNIPGYKYLNKLNPLAHKEKKMPMTKEEQMMNRIVKKLGTSFATPE